MTSTRFRQIAEDLRQRIALGELGDSGAIDSEAALGARYGASRITVRRALETLREQGLVESRKGSGWFATGSSFQQRLAIGTFHHAASAITDAGGQLARTVVAFAFEPPTPPVADVLAIDAGAEVLRCRSVRTVDGEPLDLVHEWVPASVAADLSRADATDPGIWPSLQRAGHRVGAVRQTIAAGIATSDDADLGVEPGAPLLLVRRLALTDGRAPLALSDHRYLAHRFTLEVEFNGWPGAGSETPPGLRISRPQEHTPT
jgi:GntR family transcriptional regulator